VRELVQGEPPKPPVVDGAVGRLWRAANFPLRVLSPIRFALRRQFRGAWWNEEIIECAGAGPRLTMSPVDGTSSAEELQPPEDGAGPLTNRRYEIHIVAADVNARDLLEMFRSDPNRFSPNRLATFVPDPSPSGLRAGDDVEIKIPGPWDAPVRVGEVTNDRLRLETKSGHLEAGWIEFRSTDSDVGIRFTIESYARSGDPVIDVLYHRLGIAKYVQSEMWVQVLEGLQSASGGYRSERVQVRTTIYHGADQ